MGGCGGGFSLFPLMRNCFVISQWLKGQRVRGRGAPLTNSKLSPKYTMQSTTLPHLRYIERQLSCLFLFRALANFDPDPVLRTHPPNVSWVPWARCVNPAFLAGRRRRRRKKGTPARTEEYQYDVYKEEKGGFFSKKRELKEEEEEIRGRPLKGGTGN